MVQPVILHAACEGNAQLRLVFKRDWGVEGKDALDNAFFPTSWHGCVWSCLMGQGFLNTAMPVFITALVLLLWWSSFLTCFLKYCHDQTVALAVEATLWLQQFLLAACFPVVSNTGLSLWNVLLLSDNAGYCIAEERRKISVKQKNPLCRSWYLKTQISVRWTEPSTDGEAPEDVPGKPVAFLISKAFRNTADLLLRQRTACVISRGPIQL